MDMLIVNSLCRACNTEKEKLVDIFNHKGDETKHITDMLEYCTRAPLKKNPKYPQGICYSCVKQLEVCFRFLKRFHLAQQEFQEVDRYMQKAAANADDIDDVVELVNDVNTCNSDEPIQQTRVLDNSLPVLITNVKREEPVAEMSIEYIEPTDEPPKLESSPNAVTCPACQKTFFTTKALHLHLKINHKQKTTIN